MNKSHITIKDIARALNVSPSTVSRALKDNPDISKQTRDKVKRYAQEHNYQPNTLAVNLRAQKTNLVGVIVPKLAHDFFSQVLSGIEEVMFNNGYYILVAQSDELYEKEKKATKAFLTARVGGVITSLAKETTEYSHYQQLLDNDIPVVFYDRICTEVNTERVVVDDYAGAMAAVEHLINTGCKRIAFFGSNPKLEIAKNRRNGYIDALKKHGIEVDSSLIVECDTSEKAKEITPKLLDAEKRPDAFFAINDDTAAAILDVCKEKNICVPDEISICGFSDGYVAQNTSPKLTTVVQPGKEVGKSAAEILIKKMRGETKKNNRIVRTNLKIRGTTR